MESFVRTLKTERVHHRIYSAEEQPRRDLFAYNTTLCGFAKCLVRDSEAIQAALALPRSNGPVEGQVHRLKLIKRQMYGRASFDLLRLRVLHKV